MRFLLDTHTLLWFFMGNSKLSANVKYLIEDSQNLKLISIVSVWEMTIKQSQNRLTLGNNAAIATIGLNRTKNRGKEGNREHRIWEQARRGVLLWSLS